MSDTSLTKNRDSFPLREARGAVRDLFRPRPWVYWTDFATTYAAGMFCFQQVRGGSLLMPHQGFQGSISQTLYFVASCLLFYRASMFIHEVVHQRNNHSMWAFRVVWNLLCGIPFLIPSFVYLTHIDHHRRKHFGTREDGEYMPLERSPTWQIFAFVAGSAIIPLLVVVRFLVFTPLAWLVPPFRVIVHRHASSMVMDPRYLRPSPTPPMMRIIGIQELSCFLWCLAIAVVPPVFLGRWPIPFLIHAYLTSVCIFALNAVRTLGTHRWHNDGREMSLDEQIMDSVNYPGHAMFSELWGPVGTRFHALHHLFPSLPYHALPEAHRRLEAMLPKHSPYHQARERSLLAVTADLWYRNRAYMRRSRSE